jgi:hypothetical protein
MRLLVTGAGGLIGSNLAAAAAQQSWSVLGTWRSTPVSVLGARTAQLDVADRHACVALAERLEPDVIVHAAAESSPARLEREPRLAELNLLGAENTLAAARAVHARYVLVSCDLVFSGMRPSAECWDEEDDPQPINALGRSLLACERLAHRSSGSWLITRPADVYGVNLSIPVAPSAFEAAGARAQWEPVGEHGLAANGNGAGWAALAAVTCGSAQALPCAGWRGCAPGSRWPRHPASAARPRTHGTTRSACASSSPRSARAPTTPRAPRSSAGSRTCGS